MTAAEREAAPPAAQASTGNAAKTPPVIRLNDQGTILEIAPDAAREFGCDAVFMERRSIDDFLVDPVSLQFAALANHDDSLLPVHRLSLTGRHASGRLFPVQITFFERQEGRARCWYAVVDPVLPQTERWESALRRADEWFLALMDNLPASAFIKDAEGRYVYLNTYSEQVLKLTPEQWFFKTDADLLPADIAARNRMVDREVLAGQAREQLERVQVNGQAQDWLITKFPITDASGSAYVAGFGFDITHRQNAETALQQSRMREGALLEASLDAVVAIDRQGIVLEWNRVAETIFGYARTDAVGRSMADLIIPSALRERHWAMFHRYLATGESAILNSRIEVPAMRAGGDEFPAELTVVLLEGGNDALFMATIRDLTDRRRAQEALLESEERFRSLIESVSDVISVLDAEGLIRYQSPSVERVLGYPVASMIGQSVFGYIHPDDLVKVLGAFQLGLSLSSAPAPVQMRFRHADGSWRVLEALGQDRLETPGVRGMVIVSRDITERLVAEEALEHSEQRFALFMKNLPGLAFIKDLSHRYLYVNERCALTFNRPVEQWQDKTDRDLWPEALAERMEANDDTVVQTGDVLQTTDTVPGDQGDRTWMSTKFPILDARGQPFLIGGVTVDVTEITHAHQQIADLNDRLELRLKRLEALRLVDEAITGSRDVQHALTVLLDQLTVQLKVDAADVLIYDEPAQRLEYVVGVGLPTDSSLRAFPALDAGDGILERRIIYLANLLPSAVAFPEVHSQSLIPYTTYWALPLVAKGKTLGVLEVYHRHTLDPDPEWLSFLEALAGQAAIAVDNAALLQGLERTNQELALAYDATIEGWSRALDMRDHETEGHSQRVTDLTMLLARAVGISEGELIHVRRGALLHDIGKMGVPDHVLLKPGPLTDQEWAVMRRHPELADDLLRPIPFLRESLEIPYCHHEKWDGSGYPQGLIGTQIPLCARLFAVVDVWDALRSDRPYRKGWSSDAVLAHIAAGAGSHFDPDVVQVFLELMTAAPHEKFLDVETPLRRAG